MKNSRLDESVALDWWVQLVPHIGGCFAGVRELHAALKILDPVGSIMTHSNGGSPKFSFLFIS